MFGHARRLQRLFNPKSARSLIVPVDDGLIFGPYDGLNSLKGVLTQIVAARPEALLGFMGAFCHHQKLLQDLGWIINLTASTAGRLHTRKQLIGSVEDALRGGADCVAVHVNISSRFEPEMLGFLGLVADACRKWQMPLLTIMYPRKEGATGDDNFIELKLADRKSYTKLVAHCARIGTELGADVIKTQFTGDAESFHRVVEAAFPVPVIIAGGPVQSANLVLRNAQDAISAGASGVSFGRNIFSRENRTAMLHALSAIVHHNADASEVLEKFSVSDRVVEW